MFHPDHKTVWRDPLHVAVQLKFIADVQAGLAIENKLGRRRHVQKILILPNQMLT